VLSCDVIIWDDNTPFLFFLKTSLTPGSGAPVVQSQESIPSLLAEFISLDRTFNSLSLLGERAE
jgi:hypothetical protein